MASAPTVACAFYAKGKCKRGNACRFSHNEELLFRRETEVCKKFLEGKCPYGWKCRFSHSEELTGSRRSFLDFKKEADFRHAVREGTHRIRFTYTRTIKFHEGTCPSSDIHTETIENIQENLLVPSFIRSEEEIQTKLGELCEHFYLVDREYKDCECGAFYKDVKAKFVRRDVA